MAVASEARVAMEQPRRYLSQLCKHFQHKLPVELGEDHGSIRFEFGVCTLNAEAEMLVMQVRADDPAALARLEDVIARHLLRFAFRAPPVVEWIPAA